MRTITNEDEITYDSRTDTYRLSHDWWRNRAPSAAVTAGVAAVTDTAPTDLDPLYESVDPDALNRLFDPLGEPTRHGDGRMTFPFNECRVTVHSNGTIEITPPDEDGTTAGLDYPPTNRS